MNPSGLYPNSSNSPSVEPRISAIPLNRKRGRSELTELAPEADVPSDAGIAVPTESRSEIPVLTPRIQGSIKPESGETIDSLSVRILGSLTTKAQRDAFSRAVLSINDFEGELSGIETLRIPGVDQNGDFIYYTPTTRQLFSVKDGRVENTTDGTTTVNYADGSSSIKMKNGDFFEFGANSTTITKADGFKISRDPSGETTTLPDGVQLLRDHDGKLKSVSRKTNCMPFHESSDGSGGTVQCSSGTQRDENFTLVKSNLGALELADFGPDGRERISRFSSNREVGFTRNIVLDRLQLDGRDRARFIADMLRFEQTAQDRQFTAREIVDTYKAIISLLNFKTDSRIKSTVQLEVAQQMISNAANPTSVEMGSGRLMRKLDAYNQASLENPRGSIHLVRLQSLLLLGQANQPPTSVELINHLKEAARDWKAAQEAGKFNARDHADTLATLGNLMQYMPEEDRSDILGALYDASAINGARVVPENSRLNSLLSRAFRAASSKAEAAGATVEWKDTNENKSMVAATARFFSLGETMPVQKRAQVLQMLEKLSAKKVTAQ
jgi:hypothetical protein